MASSGNFCTLNPLAAGNNINGGTFSNGNTKYASSGDDGYVANMAMTVKTYCELRIDSLGNYGGTIGFRSMTSATQTYDSITFQANYSSGVIYYYKGSSQQSNQGNIGGTVSAGNILMMAYDPATYKWWVGVNGTWRNSGDPANGTGFVFQGSSTLFEDMSAITWGGWKGGANGFTGTYNFGQDSTFGGQETAGGNADENGFGDFKYSVPAGFLAHCTANMDISSDIDPAQTNDNFPQKNFGIVTYTGNSTTGQTVSGLGFKPDLIWAKMTSSSQNNQLFDSSRLNTRGTPTPFMLRSDTTAAEIDDQAQGNNNPMIASFDTDGFTLGTSGSGPNDNNREYIAWCWRANGGTTTSDSSGDITVTRQTNAEAGFSIITYTGNGSSGSTIAHGLGVKPAMTIIKQRNSSNGWNVWHQGFDNGDYDSFGELNGTGQWYANQGSNGPFSNNPTTSLLPLTAYGQVNGSGNTYVCYAWAEVEGYSKFGSYTANGNSDGPFVYLGFRPAFIMIKGTVSGAAWIIKDDTLDGFNPGTGVLQPNSTAAKYTSAGEVCDILANGFKVRTNNAVANSTSYDPYLYAAWGSVPYKYNNAF